MKISIQTSSQPGQENPSGHQQSAPPLAPDAFTRHIYCATDLTEDAKKTADVAAWLATRSQLPLRLQYFAAELVARGDFPEFEDFDHESYQLLENERARLKPVCSQTHAILSHGDPGVEVPKSASDKADIIVVGTTGKGRLRRWLTGSTAEHIAENAPSPTLLVKQPDRLISWLKDGHPLRVLCAVDFSVSANAALAVFKDFRGLGGEIEIHAACIGTSGPDNTVLTPHGNYEEGADLEIDLWERIRSILGPVDAKVHMRAATGSVVQEFNSLATQIDADLLVIGTHQTHGLQRLRVPSFSRDVLSHSITNVLCVPLATYHPAPAPPVISRVLVATDFSPTGNAALQHAMALLPQGGAIKIVHVCAAPYHGARPELGGSPYLDVEKEVASNRANAESKLRELTAENARGVNIKISSEVLLDLDPASAICNAAVVFGADIICMGTRNSRVAKALLGSVSNSVITHAHLPVLVVPNPEL